MNHIADNIIYKTVEKAYNDSILKYGEQRIIGAYVYGNAHYGFAKDLKDIKIIILYIPTLEELCFNSMVSKKIDNNIFLWDIRALFSFKIDCLFILETLFTPYAKENPLYHNKIKELKDRREDIANIWIGTKEKEIKELIFFYLEAYELNSNNMEDIYNACRLQIMLELIKQKNSYEDCFQIKQDYYTYYLWQVKEGKCIPNIQNIKDELDNLHIVYSIDIELEKDVKSFVQRAILLLIQLSFKDRINNEEFIKTLTKTEKIAFNYILTKLTNGEGIISISQAINEINISRPVFKNLLNKMEKIATINNLGVKGTYIKMM